MDLSRTLGGREGISSQKVAKIAKIKSTGKLQQQTATRNAGLRRAGSLEPVSKLGGPFQRRRPQRHHSASGEEAGDLRSASRSSVSRRETMTSGAARLAPVWASLALFLLASVCWWPSVSAIKLQPEGREKFYWTGEQFVITCQNNHNIKNVKIRWIGPNGYDITEDRSQRVHAESSGPHGHRLVVMNATSPQDDGQYKCTLGSTDDRNPREHIEFQLKLYRTTSFLDTPRHLVLAAGQQGTLTCKVEFDPDVQSASVSWVREQRPIEMFNDSAYTVLDYDPARKVSQLLVAPLTRHQAGTYTCRAVAVTSQLSKISDHDIHLETHYGPVFEQDSHVVWVERGQSTGRHLQPANVYGGARAGQSPQPSRMRYPHNKQHHRRPATDSSDFEAQQMQQQQQLQNPASAQANSTQQVVRVELHCSCQANPPASILWTSSKRNFVLAKGEPAHILEEPRYETDGHNTSSVLVISYNMDPDWPHRRDAYICSASNKISTASKSYTVEQGDPPPAFNVGPFRQYNPQSYLFKFTLLGPNYDPDASQQAAGEQEPKEILPPVDLFRIRAESPQAAQAMAELKASGNHWPNSNARRLAELASVQFSPAQPLKPANQRHQKPEEVQNMTVHLGRLPGGQQRLYLEAHNAVGWSPNATYLGDYYIVSGASSAVLAGSGWLINVFSGLILVVMLQAQRS